MSKFVRDSKLRNVFGQSYKKDQCFDSIRVSKNNNVQMFCAVNPKFMAVVTHAAGGGSFLVLPHSKTGRLELNSPQVCGHQAPVIELAWSPFNDNLIAAGDDKGCIMLWEIPDDGLTENLETPLVVQDLHQKRCNLIRWHPTAENVILSCSVDLTLVVWDMDEGEAKVQVTCPDIVQDMCWSPDGKTFATASKDKKIRIHNGRTGEVKMEVPGHASPKDMRIALLKDNRLLSTGFTRDSTREYHLWELDDISDTLYEDTLDVTNAPLNIFYDPDMNMAYLVGKGDSVIRYYEINNDDPYFHYITTHQSPVPQRGMGFMPKRGCNVNACEIARMYKVIVTDKGGSVEPISMIVPRKSELYQADIFPDTAANEPAVTAEEWFGGKDGTPKTMSMKQFFVGKETGTSSGGGGLKKGGLKKSSGASSAAAKAPEPAKTVSAPTSSVKAPTPKGSSSVSNHSKTEDEEKVKEPVPEAKPEPKAAPSPKAPEPKPEPKAEPKREPKAEKKAEPKAEKKPEPKAEKKAEPKAEKKAESSTPPASTPSEPPAPKASVPKAKEPAAKTKKKDDTPKEPTTPKGGNNKTPVLDGKLSVKDILLDVRNLRNTVSKHEASISALEDLEASQSQEIQDLIAEITKLKATVAQQEKRISVLESK